MPAPGGWAKRRVPPTTCEAVSTAADTSPLHKVSRLAERQVQTPPWCLEYWPGGHHHGKAGATGTWV